jgi:hypothetical protein
MPIDIHLKNNKNTPLFSITDELYDSLTSAIEALEKKTGIFIDLYGDTRLTHQHAALLLQMISDEIVTKKLIPTRAVTDFTGFLQKLVREQTDVELIGD